jgi:hypothetical protein
LIRLAFWVRILQSDLFCFSSPGDPSESDKTGAEKQHGRWFGDGGKGHCNGIASPLAWNKLSRQKALAKAQLTN